MTTQKTILLQNLKTLNSYLDNTQVTSSNIEEYFGKADRFATLKAKYIGGLPIEVQEKATNDRNFEAYLLREMYQKV